MEDKRFRVDQQVMGSSDSDIIRDNSTTLSQKITKVIHRAECSFVGDHFNSSNQASIYDMLGGLGATSRTGAGANDTSQC